MSFTVRTWNCRPVFLTLGMLVLGFGVITLRRRKASLRFELKLILEYEAK